jgi:hypothetical protein
MLRKLPTVATMAVAVPVSAAGLALAANPPGNGQPGQECGEGAALSTSGGGQ